MNIKKPGAKVTAPGRRRNDFGKQFYYLISIIFFVITEFPETIL